MRVIDLINKLEQDGVLTELCRNGLISGKVVHYRDIYLRYKFYLAEGKDSTTSVQLAADDLKCCTRVVYRAIKTLC